MLWSLPSSTCSHSARLNVLSKQREREAKSFSSRSDRINLHRTPELLLVQPIIAGSLARVLRELKFIRWYWSPSSTISKCTRRRRLIESKLFTIYQTQKYQISPWKRARAKRNFYIFFFFAAFSSFPLSHRLSTHQMYSRKPSPMFTNIVRIALIVRRFRCLLRI